MTPKVVEAICMAITAEVLSISPGIKKLTAAIPLLVGFGLDRSTAVDMPAFGLAAGILAAIALPFSALGR